MITFDGLTANLLAITGDSQLADRMRETVAGKEGWNFQHVIDVETATACLADRHFVVAVVAALDEVTCAQAIKFLQVAKTHNLPTIVVYGDLEPNRLLDVMRQGASECLGRPVNLTRLSLLIDMFAAPMIAGASTNFSNGRPSNRNGLSEELMREVRSVAPLDTTVLISGETGSGKTRLSRLIHGLSPRRSKKFLAVNCGALSDTLLDSELFGHVRGAFTGADQDRIGKLERCGDGTLLLDEVDTLSPAAQVKLLQVVEDRVFTPVGAEEVRPLKARLIVASNKCLETEVQENRFRSDLFYRLNVISFRLSPLREREEDVRYLAEQFRDEFANHHQFKKQPITDLAMDALTVYDWPGNVRELRNVMERAVIISNGNAIDVKHLPPQIAAKAMRSDDHQTDDHVHGNKLAGARFAAERTHLLRALDRNNNNRSRTAEDLGISRVALYKRMRKLQIS